MDRIYDGGDEEVVARDHYPHKNINALCSSLRLLQHRLAKVHADIQSKISGGAGRAKNPHFEEYVWALATIFEDAGGRASSAFSQTISLNDYKPGKRQGPFIRFVRLLSSRVGNWRSGKTGLAFTTCKLIVAIRSALSPTKPLT